MEQGKSGSIKAMRTSEKLVRKRFVLDKMGLKPIKKNAKSINYSLIIKWIAERSI